MRWSLVGNAVTVPVARWLGERLARPGAHDRARDAALPANGRWPKAARSDGDRRVAVTISAYPRWDQRPVLTDFLQHPGKPLSVRATRGFLLRTERAQLRFAAGFQDRLRGHLDRMENPRLAETQFAVAAE